MKRFLSGALAVALVLGLPGGVLATPPAVVSSQAPAAAERVSADAVAAHLATQEIVGVTLDQAKFRGSQARVVLSDPAWPPDYAIALALVLSYDDEVAQEEAADRVNANVPLALAIAAELATDRTYVANVLRNKSQAAQSRKATRALEESEEIVRNETITRDVVKRTKFVAGKLAELRTPDYAAAHASLKARFNEAIAGHPEMLPALVDELSVSDALRQSRANVEALVREAQSSK
jgi:hypothetical protein